MVRDAAPERCAYTSDGVIMSIMSDTFGVAVCGALGIDPSRVAGFSIRATPGHKLQIDLTVYPDKKIMEAISAINTEDTEINVIELFGADS